MFASSKEGWRRLVFRFEFMLKKAMFETMFKPCSKPCSKSCSKPCSKSCSKSFEEKLPKEVIIRLFENQNEIMDLGISPISIVEEMAKEITDKSDDNCNFY